MKKNILSIVLCALCLFCLVPANAQEAKTLFVNMPDSLSPLLTAVNRADCIDFLESKMKAQVENRFGRKSEMTELSKDYISIQMSPQTTWQMKLLAINDSTQVICTVSTACAPVCDSHIQFYTTDWKELPITDFLAVPSVDDYFETPDSMVVYEFNSAKLQVDMLLVSAGLSKTDGTLTFTLTTPEYIEKETADKLKPFIRRPIVFTWKETKFAQ